MRQTLSKHCVLVYSHEERGCLTISISRMRTLRLTAGQNWSTVAQLRGEGAEIQAGGLGVGEDLGQCYQEFKTGAK